MSQQQFGLEARAVAAGGLQLATAVLEPGSQSPP
jgi:hypothetical protein